MAQEESQTPPTQEILTEVVDKEVQGTLVGQVKWFSDSSGYGFITIADGEKKGCDIFVHHSGIKPANSNYKTLRKGEYVNFNIVKGLNGLQAVDVTGINGGPLMCDIVMGSRREPPPREESGPPSGPSQQWHTVQRRGGPPPSGAPPPPPKGNRPVKNYNKYNKATRHLPAGAVV
jgi:CspA family cold shock protein